MASDFSRLNGARLAFDLDGTLVDTAPDLVRALNAAVVSEGLDPVPVAAVRAMVGRGARALIQRAYERAGAAALSEAALERRLDVFMDSYRAGIADQSRPFDGVLDALDLFAAGGAELSVCTNKPTSLARALLEALGMADRFVRIIGPEDAPAKKPDPRHLESAIGGKADRRTVLVGDSAPDADAARAAGAWCVIFEDGYSEKPARALGADRLFKHWNELPALIADLLEPK
ncbi:HAD family hydrolase [Maricaulaceae bacterium MS644]